MSSSSGQSQVDKSYCMSSCMHVKLHVACCMSSSMHVKLHACMSSYIACIFSCMSSCMLSCMPCISQVSRASWHAKISQVKLLIRVESSGKRHAGSF
jgi:hypothetical protein